MANISKIKLPSGVTYDVVDEKSGYITSASLPTKTSDLTNDSGFITSYTDEKVKQTAITNSGIVYRVLLGSSSDNYTGGVNNSSTLTYTENNGLAIGNTSSVYARYAKDGITFTRSSAGYYKIAIPESSGTNKVATFPEKTGTIAFTNDIPTITLNGTSTTSASFYAPTSAGTWGQVLRSNGTGAPSWVTIDKGAQVQIVRW